MATSDVRLVGHLSMSRQRHQFVMTPLVVAVKREAIVTSSCACALANGTLIGLITYFAALLALHDSQLAAAATDWFVMRHLPQS